MNQEFKIEKGIPLPDRKGGRYQELKYPFKKMKVGDSFIVRAVNGKTGKTQSLVSAHACVFSKIKKGSVKFTTRNVEGGCRVWRVK